MKGVECYTITPLCFYPFPRSWVPRMQNLSDPLAGAHPYQRFPLSKPVVSRIVALHAVPVYRASTYVVSAFPAHSTSFGLDFFNPQRCLDCALNHESEFVLTTCGRNTFCFALI